MKQDIPLDCTHAQQLKVSSGNGICQCSQAKVQKLCLSGVRMGWGGVERKAGELGSVFHNWLLATLLSYIIEGTGSAHGLLGG